MNPTLTLVRDNIDVIHYAEVTGRTLAGSLKRAGKGVTRRVIDITPPASAATTGAAAYRQGRIRIGKQMSAILAPVKLKGRRLIPVVFGHRLAKPVSVKTRELYPDVKQLYNSQLHAAANGARLRLNNFRGQKFYVSKSKFQTELKRRQANVGRMASGWHAAARALDVNVQDWISRHGSSRGSVNMQFVTSRMRITAQNFAPNASAQVKAELARRIPYALKYQAAAMQREINYLVGKNALEHGIKTRNFSALVPEGMMGG